MGLEKDTFFPRYQPFGATPIRPSGWPVMLLVIGAVSKFGKCWSETLCRADDSPFFLSAHICCAQQIEIACMIVRNNRLPGQLCQAQNHVFPSSKFNKKGNIVFSSLSTITEDLSPKRAQPSGTAARGAADSLYPDISMQRVTSCNILTS